MMITVSELELERGNEPLLVEPICNSFCCTSSEIYQPTNVDVLKKKMSVFMVQAAVPVQGVYYLPGISAIHGSTFVALL